MRKARRAAARRGRRLRIMFADEARFGRMNRPRPCWAPLGTRPAVAAQLIREYVYLYGAVSPKDGTCVFLILPAPDTECFQIFLNTVAKQYSRDLILLLVDGAGNHGSDQLVLPANIILHPLPPYSPELNPQENIWDEIREKSSKTTLSNPWTRSMASSKMRLSTSGAIPRPSNPSHPSPISSSHCDMKLVSGMRFARMRALRSAIAAASVIW